MKIILPEKEKIIKTGHSDSGPERYYSKNFFIRKIYYDRLQKAVDLMRNDYGRLLEAGFGNGMLFPTYNKLAKETFGIDIHNNADKVANLFEGDFRQGSVYDILFEDDYFDCVISLSVIEHLTDIDKMLQEIGRVIRTEGDVIIGFPTDNLLIKTFFWLKKSPALKEHINSPEAIIKKIVQYFDVVETNKLKIFGITFYIAVKCRKKK